MTLLNAAMLASIVAGDKFTGLRVKRDGMSKPNDVTVCYESSGRACIGFYQKFTCFMSDRSTWEIWLAPIEDEGIVYYKNAREIMESESEKSD